jgi:hypothetical protein
MKTPARLECPICWEDAYERQVSLPHTDLQEFSKPIEMFSVAMESLEEIRAFKAKCPDLDLSDDPASPDYGLPIARTRKAKLQALAAAGYQEKS